MSLLDERLSELRATNGKALVAFVTAGDPPIERLPDVLAMLQRAGVDVVELGIPFSDPIADGPVIQASSFQALRRGTTAGGVLFALEQAKPELPIVLMGYINPILRFGLDRFASAAVQAGASACIVSDLIPEEAGPWLAACSQSKLSPIFLATPNSTDARLDEICQVTKGFVYAVSRTGITGGRLQMTNELKGLLERLRSRTDLPICVGFGISEPEDVRAVAPWVDGVIVGSALVKRLSNGWSEAVASETELWLRSLKQAL